MNRSKLAIIATVCTILPLVLVVPGTNVWADNIICRPAACPDGSSGSDNIFGTASQDVIDAKAGDDHIYGFQGPDIITGGADDDAIGGGDGDDALGGDGRIVTGGTAGPFVECPPPTTVRSEGNDGIFGAEGDDFITGCGGFDLLYGGDGDDVIEGGEGNDIIVGGAGTDSADGGPGFDRCDAERETNCEANV
jgi:Ca2+-binding RTX toxin-like protein